MKKAHLAALLFATGALTASAFADDGIPGQARQSWQQLSPEQRQALRAEHREAALAKREARPQMSAGEKSAMQQKKQRKMEMHHERHEHRHEFGQRKSR